MQHGVHSYPSYALVGPSRLPVFHGNWEVAIWKWADDGSSTTSSATAAVFTNQRFCQLKAEALDVGEGTRGTVVLHRS